MKIHLILLGVLMLLSACSTQMPINSYMDCVNAGFPVMESYPRQCHANGQTFTEEIAIPVGATACPDPRPSFATKEYMPVTGSDGNIYDNWRLACMEQTVGWYESAVKRSGSPKPTQCTQEQKSAQICTADYNPVCGQVDNGLRCIVAPCPSTDAKTYSNACSACSAGSFEYYPGTCEDNIFIVCNGEAKTGFDPVQFAKDSGAICTDICPGNYDSFMTQIGIEQCIPHYGVEEISSWDTCEKSSDSCQCVRAYETTDNTPIEDAKYRCVPEEYATRFLFRGGLDSLDENGQKSVAIA